MVVTTANQLAVTVREHRKIDRLSQAAVADRVRLRQETISAFDN